MADFEFINENEIAVFTKPDLCVADVTQLKSITGGRIAGKEYSEIKEILQKYNYKPLFLD